MTHTHTMYTPVELMLIYVMLVNVAVAGIA